MFLPGGISQRPSLLGASGSGHWGEGLDFRGFFFSLLVESLLSSSRCESYVGVWRAIVVFHHWQVDCDSIRIGNPFVRIVKLIDLEEEIFFSIDIVPFCRNVH